LSLAGSALNMFVFFRSFASLRCRSTVAPLSEFQRLAVVDRVEVDFVIHWLGLGLLRFYLSLPHFFLTINQNIACYLKTSTYSA